jgi:hypothetical protein
VNQQLIATVSTDYTAYFIIYYDGGMRQPNLEKVPPKKKDYLDVSVKLSMLITTAINIESPSGFNSA